MITIINIPYLTSGRQIKNSENSENSENIENIENTKHGKLDINNPKRLDNILKKREKYLNLSGGFREAFNFKTFAKKSN